MNLEQKLQEMKRRDQLAQEGGGKERRERQHKEGKMSARERIEFLLDEGTFEETDRLVTHRPMILGWPSRNTTVMASSLDTAALMAGWYSSSRRTSQCSADHFPRPTLPKSSRSWT